MQILYRGSFWGLTTTREIIGGSSRALEFLAGTIPTSALDKNHC
jgi:hypothetical protein